MTRRRDSSSGVGRLRLELAGYRLEREGTARTDGTSTTAALAWAEAVLGVAITGVVEVSGGITSTMVRLTDSTGRKVVLRLMTADVRGDDTVAAMADVLARVHSVEPANPFPRWQSWAPEETWVVPGWAEHPQSCERAFALIAQPPPSYRPSFLHRDFSHSNPARSRRPVRVAPPPRPGRRDRDCRRGDDDRPQLPPPYVSGRAVLRGTAPGTRRHQHRGHSRSGDGHRVRPLGALPVMTSSPPDCAK